ncbi:MAG: protein kinase, partial [Phycisphaerae bacterium]|nr:protein kinase [Phycisphaerae bacterium]
MIDEKGGAKLVDFGLARIGEGQVADGAALGTPYYVAPEQVLRESIDHRTDIYSLGATLFHILACMPPFPGKTVKEVVEARLEKPAPGLLK